MRMQPAIALSDALDRQLASRSHVKALSPSMFDWSRTIRAAIGLPVTALAGRLGVSQPSATNLEQNEAAGTITIARLEALANALDCDFVYGFIPRRPLAEVAREIQSREDAARRAKRKIPPRV